MNTIFTIFSIQGAWQITECFVRGVAKIPVGVVYSKLRIRGSKTKPLRRKLKQIRKKSLSSLA